VVYFTDALKGTRCETAECGRWDGQVVVSVGELVANHKGGSFGM